MNERIKHILKFIYSTAPYSSLVDKERALTIYGASSLLLLLATALALTANVGGTGQNIFATAQDNDAYTIGLLAFYTLMPLSIIFTRLGWLPLGALGMVFGWSASFGLVVVSLGFSDVSAGVIVMIQILLGALLLKLPGLILGTALTVGLIIAGYNHRHVLDPNAPDSSASMYALMFIMAIFVGIVYLFLRYSRLSHEEGLESALQERLVLAEITSQITRGISARAGLQNVLDNTIEQITSNYDDIYHAQIFLIDEGGRVARLVASTGEVGQRLLENRHSLGVGSESVIGRVTGDKQLVVARARALNTVHRRNEYLPETLVEAAFPLMRGDTVIGALDLQSKKPYAFPDRDLPMYQTLADHIAISIDNARLFEEAERRIEENRGLAEQSRSALREVERMNMRLIGHAWSEFLQNNRSSIGLMLDFDKDTAQPGSDWTESLQEAVRSNQIVQQRTGKRPVVSVPLRVRGQPIGAMEFELDENGQLAPEDMELIAEISERFGLAVENARLYQDSQRSAQREALINEIGTKLQASNNVAATLNEAAHSLQKTLKARKVAIRLGQPSAAHNGENGDSEGNGHTRGGGA